MSEKTTQEEVKGWRGMGNSLATGDTIKTDHGNIYTVSHVTAGGLRIHVVESSAIFVHPTRIVSVNGVPCERER